MDAILYALALFAFGCMVWLIIINWNKNGIPPYALRIPIIGNMYLLITNREARHKVFGKIGKKLGPVFTIWFGKVPVIIVNDFEIANKILMSSTFSGRPQRLAGEIVSRGFKGIVTTDYTNSLKERRRTAIKAFQWHDTAMLELTLSSEAAFLVQRLQSKIELLKTNIFEINDNITLTAFNIIWKLLFNRRIENERNKEFVNTISMLDLLDEGLLYANILEAFPLLKKISKNKVTPLYKYSTLRDNIIIPEFENHIKSSKIISKVRKSYQEFENHTKNNETNCITDFVDLLLSEDSLTRDEQEVIVSDLIAGGFHTITNAINFVIMYLILNPDVIGRCTAEIRRVLIGDKDMSLSLLSEFHYINAVIAETLRLRPVIPLGVPHKTIMDANIMNFTVKKNTSILINIYDIHHNENYFKNANEFIPERFLDSKGHYKALDGYLPYACGRRECLGKRFAEKEIVYLVVTLLKNFDLSLPFDEHIDTEPFSGTFLRPKPFKVKIEKC